MSCVELMGCDEVLDGGDMGCVEGNVEGDVDVCDVVKRMMREHVIVCKLAFGRQFGKLMRMAKEADGEALANVERVDVSCGSDVGLNGFEVGTVFHLLSTHAVEHGMSKLRHVRVAGLDFGTAGVNTAALFVLSPVESFELSGCTIGPAAFWVLFRSLQAARDTLQDVVFDDTNMGSHFGKLCETLLPCTGLRTLSVTRSRVVLDEAALAMFGYLVSAFQLTRVDLSGNVQTPEMLDALLTKFELSQLIHLELEGCGLNEEQTLHLATLNAERLAGSGLTSAKRKTLPA